MVAAGDNLISCHTDGAWLYPLPEPLQDWRVKAHATRIDLLDPQVLRYWGAKGDRPRVVYSGVTASEADTAFETAWANQGFANV
jgi:hypothetical protein